MTDQQNAALERIKAWTEYRRRNLSEVTELPILYALERAFIAGYNATRPAPAGAEAVRDALLGECVEALRVIAFDPHNATKVHQVAEAAWHHSKDWRKALAKAPSTGELCGCGKPRGHLLSTTPQPAPTAAEDGLRAKALDDSTRPLTTLEQSLELVASRAVVEKNGLREAAKEALEELRGRYGPGKNNLDAELIAKLEAALRAKPSSEVEP